jgi:hypothetical protein
MNQRPDPEALLVALVLCPGTYSRNRFFELFTDPQFFAVRRRAKLLRGIILEATGADPARRGHNVTIDERGAEGAMLTYVVPSLNLRRTTALSELELAVVRYAFAARTGPFEPLAADDPARSRIEEALQRLAPDLAGHSAAAGCGAPFGDDADDPDDTALDADVTLGFSPLPDTGPER